MKFFSSSVLAMAALGGQALAIDCAVGDIDSPYFQGLKTTESCSLGANSIYTCDWGSTLTHHKDSLVFQVGEFDTAVAVICDDSKTTIYSCPAGVLHTFPGEVCPQGLSSVYNTARY
ncbi:hypothetical protein E4U55_004228 [Claviceps digitariae]|nr:hypothetical protein E4U55_004228 [Claviceps digitariae]